VRSIVEYLGYVNLALLTCVALVALREWRAGRGRAGVWAALAFGTLAIVADAGPLLPEDPHGFLEGAALRLLIAALVLFPFFLYRFTAAFLPAGARLEWLVSVMTVVVLAWTFALPDIPQEGEPRPIWFVGYIVAFLVHWAVLVLVSSWRLWRGGRGQPGVARRRMQLLAAAAAGITVSLVIAAFASDAEGSAISLASACLTVVSALGFLLGLAPPALLRAVWRRPEQSRMQTATAQLMAAGSEEDVASRVLEPMLGILGARAAALRRPDGSVIASEGATDAMVEALDEEGDEDGHRLTIDFPEGSLVVWASAFAPFFGREELRILASLAGLTGLALDRARLFSQEREARLALERADRIKSEFIALAAHELRTPVTTVHASAQTLHARREQLTKDQTATLVDVLAEQTERLRILLEQLLDLSRLEAEAVEISPEPFGVRGRLEVLVQQVVGEGADGVRIDAPDDLEVEADASAFDRVVSNLLQNAVRYGAPPITVEARATDRHLRVTVEDRGPGVAPAFVPQLFERFSRSDPSRSAVGGTGLGLAIARSYAQAHRGDLRYEPASPRGARFQLVLPLRE
jgi:signal transduction histidine kinase